MLNVGSLYWLHVQIEHLEAPGEMLLSKWSGLSEHEGLTVAKMLLVHNSSVLLEMKEAAAILHNIEHELFHEEIGYCTRVNQLVDELFILIARQSTRQINVASRLSTNIYEAGAKPPAESFSPVDCRRDGGADRVWYYGLYGKSKTLYGLLATELPDKPAYIGGDPDAEGPQRECDGHCAGYGLLFITTFLYYL